MSEGMVYIIGAGPGDPKLITVKGLERLKEANTIIYDRLASYRLLSFARRDAEIIYAGKSPAGHTMKQKEINRLLVEKARAGKIVIRLKGGDPFVFGRGGEEAEALYEAGVSFEVVPGVTSAIAAPAYAGIPVTHRGLASDLVIVTGNEDPLKESSNIAWEHLAADTGTLILLMGMANLPEITKTLVKHGRSPQTPVALVQWGTRPNQRTLTGNLANINEMAVHAGLESPVVIVVGNVVKLRDKLRWYDNKPLFGKRILVTRAREQASALSEKIEALGGEALEFPAIVIAEPEDYVPLDQALRSLAVFEWIIFTSVNGVTSFFQRLRRQRIDVRELCRARLCAIGPKTREALENYGLIVEYVPGEYRAEKIAAGLSGKLKPGERVLLPRAAVSRQVLPETLRELGAEVTEVTAYRALPASWDGAAVKELLIRGEIDVVTFTSSSTVRNFATLIACENIGELMANVIVACIGPVTAATAMELGIKVDVVAAEYTIDGLVTAIMERQHSSS
ncbi:MAG: uroporphyrinogen-III C-methyltransferase [Desulfotomaculaceae bacterium]|nr:uroporphyrinogen-III C-methyltransferase [Desulfotomaculaceae bacterium]